MSKVHMVIPDVQAKHGFEWADWKDKRKLKGWCK